MIHSIKSNNSNFKTVKFHAGFNVILADRKITDVDDKKNSRNGAGKTTLVEIIHFCLGSNVLKDSIFKNKHLAGWSFSLEIDIGKNIYTIERFIDKPNKIYIDGKLNELHFELKFDKELGRYYVNKTNFNQYMLGEIYGIFFTNNSTVNYPTFRELISYTVRKGIEAYLNPFQYFSRQNSEKKQICNVFLLNLNLEYATQFQNLNNKTKEIKSLQKTLKLAISTEKVLSIGELNALLSKLNEKKDELEEQISSFKVHMQYEEISQKANLFTDRLHKLASTLCLRENLLNKYIENIRINVQEVPLDMIKKVYEEAGVVFGDKLEKSLNDVIDFHKKLIINRKEYLMSEINIRKKEIEAIKDEMEKLDKKRSELLYILKTHGALTEQILLQKKYAECLSKIENIKQNLRKTEEIQNATSLLKIENEELLLKTRQDYSERSEIRNKAIRLFMENTGRLYSEPGCLNIDLNNNGYFFSITMKQARSQGINYMKVFCYDFVIAELGKERNRFPDFLVHDSTIFDGVDERQVSEALKLALEKCNKKKLQYICLMNSDNVPYSEFSSSFNNEFTSNVVLRISDENEEGCLLGMKF